MNSALKLTFWWLGKTAKGQSSSSAGNAKEGYLYGQHHPKVRFDDSVLYEGSAAYTYMALRWSEMVYTRRTPGSL